MSLNSSFISFSLICLIFIISFVCGVLCFKLIMEKFCKEKSFEQIYSELSSKKVSKKITAIKCIHKYFKELFFEVLIINNLKYKNIRYFPYWFCFLQSLTITFIFSINIIYPSKSFIPLLYLVPALITSIPIFIIGAIYEKTKVVKISWAGVFFRYVVCVIKGLIINLSTIFFSFLIVFIMIMAISYLLSSQTQEIKTDLIKIPGLIQNNYLICLTNYLEYLFEFNINDERIKGNQLSLAGFYFTLAVGGTVVLSIINLYYKKMDLLKKQLEEQVQSFKLFYSANSSCLNLNLSDIINLDLKNIKKLKIKRMISLNNKKIKDFHGLLSQIKKTMNFQEIESRHDSVMVFNFFICDIILTYVLGIVTILIPNFATIFFWLFVIDSIIFIFLLLLIYQNYKESLLEMIQ